MPRIKSAKKALRQNARRKERNDERKKVLKAAVKNFRKVSVSGDKKDTAKDLSLAFKRIDKAAKVGLIKRNKADRMKSRISKLVK